MTKVQVQVQETGDRRQEHAANKEAIKKRLMKFWLFQSSRHVCQTKHKKEKHEA